jgi:hypothetical protein
MNGVAEIPAGKLFSSPYLRRLHASKADYVLSPYVPASWWDHAGTRKMVRRLMKRGFPQLFGWLFVTLTIDPDEFASPLEAYLAGDDRIRRMIHALRETGYHVSRYFWKFELTKAGWPHWHLCLDTRDFISNEEVASAWGLGFAKTKRVSKRRDFKYLFKYVCKDPGDLPEWVLDFPRRIRVFQTSAGFYGKTTQARIAREATTELIEKRTTLREKITHWDTLGTVRVRASFYRGVTVTVRGGYIETFVRRVNEGARPLDAYHIPLTQTSIERDIEPWKPSRRPKSPPSAPRLISDSCRMALTPSRVA